MALTAAAKEMMFLTQLLTELGLTEHCGQVLFEDNQGCIALSSNSVTNERSKHIDVRYHFCRERVQSGELQVKHCPTEYMVADVLTKPLGGPRHKALCATIMGEPPEEQPSEQ